MSPQRTFWHLEAQRRVPSPYELKSSKLLYYPEHGFSVKTPVAAWLERHQAGSALDLTRLAGFRDPRETTYTSYVALAREREAFVEGLFRSAAESGYDARLSNEWCQRLEGWLPVLLYPCHGLQMVTAYLGQLAPVSELVITLAFQTGDEIRRIQRIAERLVMLGKTRPGFGEGARRHWQDGAAWQPLRRVIEELLVTYDFGESIVRHSLVVKPLLDALFVRHGGRVAEARQDPLLSRLLFSLNEDAAWHEQVTGHWVGLLVEGSEPNRDLIAGWVQAAYPAMQSALRMLEPLLDPAEPAGGILAAVERETQARFARLGLPVRTNA